MQALDNVRVVEFSRMHITSFATMILSEFGAEVIKVDSPQIPLAIRGGIPSPNEQRIRAGVHHSFKRNKKSIALDLKAEEGRQILLRLVQQDDVLLETFSPVVIKRLGLDYGAASRLNPGIVYCSVSGYGQSSPYRDLPGHDVNYISLPSDLDAPFCKRGGKVR